MQDLDPFDRQLNVEDWNQEKIRKSRILILGVGGLGSVVLIHLLRLGVGKINMLDFDKVCKTNLNRQLMFSLNDIDKYKVDAAFENAKFHNVGQTEIIPHNFDATKNWDKVVTLAQESDVIFNLIDHGDHWDAAVQSLAIKLKIPVVLGGNYENNVSVDFYPPQGQPCFACMTDSLKKEFIEQITPDKILFLKDISFLPKNDNPKSKSYSMLCTLCGVFIANLYKNFLINEEDNKTKRILFYMNDFSILQWDVQENAQKDCLICGHNWIEPQVETKENKE